MAKVNRFGESEHGVDGAGVRPEGSSNPSSVGVGVGNTGLRRVHDGEGKLLWRVRTWR